MKRGPYRFLRSSALAILATFSSLAVDAVTVTPGPADAVVWEQTGSFSLGQAGGTI